jgi:hypothetical protein
MVPSRAAFPLLALGLLSAACGSTPDSVKHADTATRASTADAADQVNWVGVQGKPSWVLAPTTYAAGSGLTLTGNVFSIAAAQRTGRLYFPASSLATTSTLTRTALGVAMPATGANTVTWIGPRPTDWIDNDSARPFKVTIYFLVPSGVTGGDMKWRMVVGGAEVNLPAANATAGWDSPVYTVTTDATSDSYAADGGGHGSILKSQTFAATWAPSYGGWTFPPSGVTTANFFSNGSNAIWQFGFQRGHAVANGEANLNDFTVIGIAIEYPAS